MADRPRRRRVGWGEVVAMAARLIRERGIDSLTFEAIAERLGTDTPDVCYWFDERHELLSAVMKVRQERFMDFTWAQLAEQPDHAAKLRTLLEISAADHNAVYLIELWKLALRDSSARELREDITDRYRHMVSGVIRSGVEAGEFEDVPVEMVSLILVNLLASLSVQATLGESDTSGEEMLAASIEAAEALVGVSLS
jgi:AcrR family transcriptional regulator